MKAFKNRLEEMAEATVNALDYSDSKVEYPDISIVQKWPKEIILPLYDLYKNTRYSELTSILMLSLQAEKETLEEYYKVFDSLNKKEEYIKRSDYIPVTYLIQKFIADEEYHISLLKKALKEYEDSDDEPKKCKSVTVII